MLPKAVLEAAVAQGVVSGSAVIDVDARLADTAANWLRSPDAGRLAPVRHYLFYLKWMY